MTAFLGQKRLRERYSIGDMTCPASDDDETHPCLQAVRHTRNFARHYMANVLEHDGNMGMLYIASINGTL